jgi:hypothetical protein
MGRGNTRLIAWDGEKTLTFNMEDALLTPEGFSILSGARLISATDEAPVYVHSTSQIKASVDGTITLEHITACNNLTAGDNYNENADMYIMVLDDNGYITDEPCVPTAVTYSNGNTTITCSKIKANKIILVDYYVAKKSGAQ